MIDLLKIILKNDQLKINATILIGIILLMLLIFFIQYNIDRAKGRHAKFLWFEVNRDRNYGKETDSNSSVSVQNSKNVNVGTNTGNIGDTYTGIKQRILSKNDAKKMIEEINIFRKKYPKKINDSHITVAYPGDRETKLLADQVLTILNDAGITKVQFMYLQTFGSSGKKFGVSNAPDNTLMVEIYPADNVK